MDPRIHIGIDNCFALKRWTKPDDWARVIKDMGMKYIEGVPDLDAEPLLSPDDYRKEWIHNVCEAQSKYGVQTVMIYSNNTTYDTTGMAHPDKRFRDSIVDRWFENFCQLAAGIGSDIGYFVHGLSEEIMFDKNKRLKAQQDVIECMTRINQMADRHGIEKVALEQMYTPHMPPFTIDGMARLMRVIKKTSGKDLHFTEDVGHHCPYYVRPDADAIKKAFKRYKTDGYIEVWLGSKEALELFKNAKGDSISDDVIKAIEADMDENRAMFSAPRDNDCYGWLEDLGCYSSVVHLQQTNGASSSHAVFTPENNENGIIHPVKILKAIAESYKKPIDPDMPARCEDIYLIQEVYMSTKEVGYQGLWRMQESTNYIRKFIPKDGMTLSELLKYNNAL